MPTNPETAEPHEGIDPYNNAEQRAAQAGDSPLVSRGTTTGAAESGHAPADEQPAQTIPGGTAGGSPLEGVAPVDDAAADEGA